MGFLFCVFIVFLAVSLPILITKLESAVFSDERVKRELKKDGLSDKDAAMVLELLKPKVGQSGLPAWESKKRNLRKEEL